MAVSQFSYRERSLPEFPENEALATRNRRWICR